MSAALQSEGAQKFELAAVLLRVLLTCYRRSTALPSQTKFFEFESKSCGVWRLPGHPGSGTMSRCQDDMIK